jgi:CheY-like chemotaxis protein
MSTAFQMRPPSERDLVTIVVVDDDPDDQLMIERALRMCVRNDIHVVGDGEALMAYLEERHCSMTPDKAACCLVLLDLNMPRKSGHEVLREMKADARLRSIPVIVLTTSEQPEEIERSYDLGANAYVTKPVSFSGFVAAMRGLNSFWFDIVQLPHAPPLHRDPS